MDGPLPTRKAGSAMSLITKAAMFARTPQGRRLIAKATGYAQSPEGKRRIAQVREQVIARGSGRRSTR